MHTSMYDPVVETFATFLSEGGSGPSVSLD